MTPEEVLANITTELPEGAFLTTAVVLVEYSVPATDGESAGPFLAHAYSEGGVWRVLGMLELMASNIRLRANEFYQDGD